MKKVTILALHLGYGGIEKCVTSLANMLVKDYDIEILCTYKLMDDIPYELDSRVSVKYLTNVIPNKDEFKQALKNKNIIKIIKEGFKSLKILRLKKKSAIDAVKYLDSDCIISTRDYFNFIVSKYAKANQFKIAWEHNDLHLNNKYVKNLVKSCKKIDRLVLVNNFLKEFYETKFKNSNTKCVFIHNFIDEIPKDVSNLDNDNLIAVGRLESVKGYDDLIDIIKLVNTKHNVRLNIIGDGSKREELQNKINSLGLSDIIKLHGYQNKEYINNYYENSSLFLMTSLSESFGLVLVEAMSYGLPCLAFDSAYGALEIITNDYNGYLISKRDKQEYADKIIDLLSNREELKTLGNNSRNTALKYDKDKIKELWIKLLEGEL